MSKQVLKTFHNKNMRNDQYMNVTCDDDYNF